MNNLEKHSKLVSYDNYVKWSKHYDQYLKIMFKDFCIMLNDTKMVDYQLSFNPKFYNNFTKMIYDSSSKIII